MLSNQQINEIHRLHWHQKWSLRQIARHLNLNRRTVAKYLIQPAPPRPRPQRTSKLELLHATGSFLRSAEMNQQAGAASRYWVISAERRRMTGIRKQSTRPRSRRFGEVLPVRNARLCREERTPIPRK